VGARPSAPHGETDLDERAFTILTALMPGASDAFGVTGPTSRMMWVNPAFERMTGHRLTG